MSQLSQVKNQVNQIATNITQTAAALTAYAQNLQTQIAAVNNAIGGTTSNEDKEMVAAMQVGMQSVKAAALQLTQAATKAKDWVAKA